MKRRIYLAAAIVLALVAAELTLQAQHTVPVLVATHDLRAGSSVTADDLSVQRMHQDSVPPGALTSVDDAAGQYAAWPLTSGEPVLRRELSNQPSGANVTAGFNIPSGYRAVAIPVAPAAAVGGLLSPGDRVDVYATPNKQSTSQDESSVASTDMSVDTTVLGRGMVVLQLRSDQGQSLDVQSDDSVHGLNFGGGKLGSVVIAVPAKDVDRYAAAAANDTMYVALTVT